MAPNAMQNAIYPPPIPQTPECETRVRITAVTTRNRADAATADNHNGTHCSAFSLFAGPQNRACHAQAESTTTAGGALTDLVAGLANWNTWKLEPTNYSLTGSAVIPTPQN